MAPVRQSSAIGQTATAPPKRNLRRREDRLPPCGGGRYDEEEKDMTARASPRAGGARVTVENARGESADPAATLVSGGYCARPDVPFP
jgi:hypothetical protein